MKEIQSEIRTSKLTCKKTKQNNTSAQIMTFGFKSEPMSKYNDAIQSSNHL
jgi:hypothetical protein